MKTLREYGGKRRKEKEDVQESEARYWGTMGRATDRPFQRSDGSIGKDKSRGWHSRPGQKETRRNANRSINKRARQILKRNLQAEAEENAE